MHAYMIWNADRCKIRLGTSIHIRSIYIYTHLIHFHFMYCTGLDVHFLRIKTEYYRHKSVFQC
jgi:hypothetical protein